MMKHKASTVFLMNLLLWIGLLNSGGFASHVEVYTPNDRSISIEKLLINDVVISSHNDTTINAYPITHKKSYIVNSYIEIAFANYSIAVAHDQKFYVPAQKEWVNANQLKPHDELLCCDNKKIAIKAVRPVLKQQLMHALSVDTSHIFCVTPYRILAHNMEPSSIIGIATLSMAFPPAAAVVAASEIVFLGVASILAYRAYKKRHFSRVSVDNQQISNGCFSTNSQISGTNDHQLTSDSGCFTVQTQTINNAQDCSLVIDSATKNCDIILQNQTNLSSTECSFPIIVINKVNSTCEKMQKNQDQNVKKRVDTSLPEAKSTWKATTFAPGKLETHFDKHVIKKEEWGKNIPMTVDDYLDKAKTLLNSEINENIESFISKEGWIFKYNKSTNELAIAKPDGTIETLFRPTDELNYWTEQIKKYK